MNAPKPVPSSSERELFLQALDRATPEERAAFLDEACGKDSPLRHRLGTLLQQSEGVGDFLEKPIVPPAKGDPHAARVTQALPEATNCTSTVWAAGEIGVPGIALSPTLGDYELIEEIARGGMGVVYKARQKSLNRIVAVKMILAGQFAGEDIAQRFKTEARAAARLRHPNIVAVHEVGVHEGQHFFSMEYVQGQNLTQLVGSRPLPPTTAARYVKVIAEAIDYAHEQGILHRDLKPSNVLIDAAHDQPRVTDFGLAKWLDEDVSLTLTGQVLGSPNFMPPEQASGSRGKVGRPSDVYGVGAILFYALTARAPFQGATLETTLQEVLHAEPISPRVLNPSTPPDLETICLKCLEKEPSRRYTTAQELADELGRFLHHEPILARPVSQMERAWRWCRRKPLVAGLSGLSLLLLLIAAIGSARQAAVLRRNLYVADINNASQAVQRQEFGRAREVLQRYQRPGLFQEDLRGIEWRFLWQQCQADPHLSAKGHMDEVTCAVVSPDGAWLVTAGYDRTVHVRDARSGKTLRTLEGFESFVDLKSVAFSPDGRWLVVKGGERLLGWRTSNWQALGPPIPVQPNWNVNNAVAFAPDGRTIATRVPGGIGFVDVQQWRTNSLVLPDTNRRHNSLSLGTVLVYSPDGSILALSDHYEIVIRDARSPARVIQSLLRRSNDGNMRVTAVAISPGYLAAGYRDGVVTLWDRNDWHEITSFEAQHGYVYDLTFSPDSDLLASCGEGHAVQIWPIAEVLQSAAASRPLPKPTLLRGHSRHVNSVAFIGKGRQLVSSSADRTVRIWNVSIPWSQYILPGSERPIWISANGRHLIGTGSDSQVHRWDTDRRLDLGPVGRGLRPDQVLAIAPDGDLAVLTPQPGRLELRSLNTGELVREFENLGSTFREARFAAVTTKPRLAFATVDDGMVSYWFWDVDGSGQPVQVGTGSGVTPDNPKPVFCLSGDGQVLGFANSKGGIQLYRGGRALLQTLLTGDEDMLGLGISPNGAILAAGGLRNYKIRLWDIRSGRELDPMALPESAAVAVEFSPDGKTLLSCSLDGDVRFWSVALRKDLMALQNDNFMRYFLLFSTDGSSLAMPGPEAWTHQGRVSVWRAPSLKEIDQIEARRIQNRQPPPG